MAKFVKFLDRLIHLYLYFVIMTCFLSLVPYINPNYSLFRFIFTSAGFYLVPPIFGISFSPAIVMIVLVLCSLGLQKLYDKYYAKDEPKIIVITPEEFINEMNRKKEEFLNNQESDERKDDEEEEE